ncbi:helix-turn-helix domain-containing protein [Singulisphaera sp. PoT]|uniref:helix-turn-helix domain-containing protein n=1 Tax=Singulisphaera sp. PoT TaxID=3411797 RepID=UPI003BF4A6D2
MRLIDKALLVAMQKGLNQADLAKLLDIPPSRISEWKSAAQGSSPNLSQALNIARVLDVSLDWLADESKGGPIQSTRNEEISEDEFVILKLLRLIKLETRVVFARLLLMDRSMFMDMESLAKATQVNASQAFGSHATRYHECLGEMFKFTAMIRERRDKGRKEAKKRTGKRPPVDETDPD